MIRSPEQVRGDRSLAINGGAPRRALPAEDAGICSEAADDVRRIVESGKTCYWRGGPRTHELEATIAALLGRGGAFFHNSGSAALLTGLHALDAGRHATVAISSSGFVASLNAVYHAGSRPVFLPTDEHTLVVSRDAGAVVDEPIDVLLVTQFFGNVVDVDALRASIAPRAVLEDASQALGSRLDGRLVGGHGEVATFAGSQKKLLGSGTGGINVYDDPEIGERMRVLAHHGKGHTQFAEVPGFNFFGGEIEAALALAALRRLEEKVAHRREAAGRMLDVLTAAGLACAGPPPGVDCEIAWFDVAVVLPEPWRGEPRDWLVEALQLEGVPTWYYPALIDMPWVEPWMTERGWWGEREEATRSAERALWDRVFVIATQIPPDDAERCAQIVAEKLTCGGSRG